MDGFLRHFAGFSGRWHHDRATAFCPGPLGREDGCSRFSGRRGTMTEQQRPVLGCHGPLRRDFALSGEGVVSSHSVVAIGLVSRHRSEFDTLRAVRFCGLEAVAQAILGARESLQRRSKTTRLQAAAQQLRNRLPAACQLP